MSARDRLPSAEETEALLARAEAALAELEASYPERLRADVAAIEAAARRLDEDPGPAACDALYDLVHDLKGQAGTFGYPLITEIGDHLCHYLRRCREAGAAPEGTVVRLHVRALAAVAGEDLRGDGGETGRRLCAGLARIAARPPSSAPEGG